MIVFRCQVSFHFYLDRLREQYVLIIVDEAEKANTEVESKDTRTLKQTLIT